jgi:hypothetical protein
MRCRYYWLVVLLSSVAGCANLKMDPATYARLTREADEQTQNATAPTNSSNYGGYGNFNSNLLLRGR